jgi:hypothetical protein
MIEKLIYTIGTIGLVIFALSFILAMLALFVFILDAYRKKIEEAEILFYFIRQRKKFKEYLKLKKNLHKNPIDGKDIGKYMANLES